MHPNLIEMVRYTSRKKIIPNLTTNGYLLAAESGQEMLVSLKQAGLGQLQFSLNGSTPEIHGLSRPHFGKLRGVFQQLINSEGQGGDVIRRNGCSIFKQVDCVKHFLTRDGLPDHHGQSAGEALRGA